MKAQVSLDLLFAVFFILTVFSIYTGYVDYFAKRVYSTFSYILCDYIAKSTAYDEAFLRKSGQKVGGDFSISMGGGNYGVEANVAVSNNNVVVRLKIGKESLITCSEVIK